MIAMDDVTLRVVAYGVLAAASAVTFLATLIVLGSGRGRANGSAYLAGFLLGQTATCAIALFVGTSVGGRKQGHSTAVAVLDLVVGALLIALASRQRRDRDRVQGERSQRVDSMLQRLGRLSPGSAFSAGVALGVGAKRLVITVLASATISASGVTGNEEVRLAVLYVLVASVVVWLPVALYLIAGSRADPRVARSKAWVQANVRVLTFWSSLVIGILFCAEGIGHLLD